MLNVSILMGRLCNDPELKTTNKGINLTNFTLAVDRNYKNPNGEYDTDFINIVAFKSTADFITRYFSRGDMIAVQGPIQTRNYDDKQGNKRTAFEIVADNVSFCGSKNDTSSTNTSQAGQPQFSTNDANDFEMLDGTDSDLPF